MKSIFSKVFLILIAILVISFTVTGILLNVGIDRLVTGQRSEALRTAAEKIENGLEMYLKGEFGVRDFQFFQRFVETLSENTDSIIWIVREDGAIIMTSAMPDSVYESLSTNDEGWLMLPDARQYQISGDADGKAYQTGDFYGLFAKTGVEWITVREAFSISDIPPHNTKAKGLILVHSQMPVIEKSKYSILGIFLISGSIGAIIAVVLAYILSRRLVRPLKIMKTAARRIASGEFTERIAISGKDEIAELGQSFNHMVEALENLENMRRDFVSNVSHELRTPVTTIKGFIDGILDDVIPKDRQAYYLGIVKDEVARMQGLVNDLLDLARMQSGQTSLRMTDFDINELVRRCVISLQQMFVEKDLEFAADFETERLFVSADRDAIQRAMINLLHNAIKFTPNGGKITVRTMEKENVTVVVEDTGQGIPKNELPYVFERFYKADKSRGMDKTGVGLGLAIVKNIIHAHQETIRVESEEGRGSRFIFSLPSGKDTSQP